MEVRILEMKKINNYKHYEHLVYGLFDKNAFIDDDGNFILKNNI